MLQVQVSRKVTLFLMVILCLILPTTAIAAGLIGSSFVIAESAHLDSLYPSVAYNPIADEYMVVWVFEASGIVHEIRAQRISDGGQLLGSMITVSSDVNEDKVHPDVVFNPDDGHFLIVWENLDSSGFQTINGRRLSSAGVVLDGSDIEISGSPSPNYYSENPAVAYSTTSERYIVVWDELSAIDSSESIYGQAVKRDGSLDGNNFLISGQDTETRGLPDIAYDPDTDQFFVVWEEDHTPFELLGRMVNGAGGASGGVMTVISEDENCQNPRITALPGSPADSRFMVGFTYEYQVDDRNLYLAFLNSSGVAQSILLFDTSDHDVTSPAVAANPDSMEYIVIWISRGTPDTLYAGFIDKTGYSSWEKLEVIQGGLFSPAVSHGNLADFLVVWDIYHLGEQDEIHGYLIGNRQFLPMTLR
jgi:hypothetical protein